MNPTTRIFYIITLYQISSSGVSCVPTSVGIMLGIIISVYFLFE